MLIKDDKANFIPDHHSMYGDHCNGVLQQERESALNSKYSLSKWEFIAKEQGGGQWMEVTKRKHHR